MKKYFRLMFTICILIAIVGNATAFASLNESVYAVGETYSKQTTIKKLQPPSRINQHIETHLIDIFIEYAQGIRKLSFKAVEDSLYASGYDFDSVVPTNKDFGSHDLYDENGFDLHMGYMPIDSSYDSQDFGKVEKEMLDMVALSRGDRSITVTNNMHTTGVEYVTYDKERSEPNQEVSSMDELLKFFQDEMGGAVTEKLTEKFVGLPSGSSEIEQIVKLRAEEYPECKIKELNVNLEYGSEDEKYIIMAYLEWNRKNSLKKIKELIQIYSDDLAAYLAGRRDDISEIYVFWMIPEYYGEDVAAKSSYDVRDGNAYRDSQFGFLY